MFQKKIITASLEGSPILVDEKRCELEDRFATMNILMAANEDQGPLPNRNVASRSAFAIGPLSPK